jgi:hypothetical protein
MTITRAYRLLEEFLIKNRNPQDDDIVVKIFNNETDTFENWTYSFLLSYIQIKENENI